MLMSSARKEPHVELLKSWGSTAWDGTWSAAAGNTPLVQAPGLEQLRCAKLTPLGWNFSCGFQLYCEMFPSGMACKVSFVHVQQPYLHFQGLSCTERPSYLRKQTNWNQLKLQTCCHFLVWQLSLLIYPINCINSNVYYKWEENQVCKD